MAEQVFPADVKQAAEAAYVAMRREHDGSLDPIRIVKAIGHAILAERERCARVADIHALEDGTSAHCQGCGEVIAAAILKGGT